MTEGPDSNINSTEIEEESVFLLRTLQGCSADAERIAEQFCERYTASPRGDVLENMARKLRRRRLKINQDVLLTFLRTLHVGVISTIEVKYIRSLLNVALATSTETTAQLLVEYLREDSSHTDSFEPGRDSLRRISLGLRPRDEVLRVVATTLEVAIEKDIVDSVFLANWSHVFLPLADPRQGDISRSDASTFLDILRNMTPDALPEELVMALPLLIGAADGTSRRRFLDSPSGETMGEFLTQESPDAHRTALPAASKRHQRKFVLSVKELFAAHNHEIELLRRQIEEKSDRLCGLRNSKQALEEELGSLKAEHDELRQTHEEEMRRIEEELEAAHEERDRWKREVRLQKQDIQIRQEETEQAHREEIRSRLLRPARHLRDHMIRLLEDRSDAEAVRVAAVAFDALHMKLMSMVNSEEESRIPEELLRPEGRQQDERPG